MATAQPMSRRSLLGRTGVAVGAGVTLAFRSPTDAAATPRRPDLGDTIVYVFLRGGADGLSLVAPHRMPSYRALRPTLRVRSPEEFTSPARRAGLPLVSGGSVPRFPLSGTFAFHPAMASLHAGPWAQGRMAVIHAAGLPASVSTTRSHFDAMRWWETGGSASTTSTGFLNRFLDKVGGTDPVRGLGVGTALARSLHGGTPTFAIDDLSNFGVGGFGDDERATALLRSWYPRRSGDALSTTAANTLGIVASVADVPWNDPAFGPAGGAVYPDHRFAQGLRQVAMALRSDLGVRVATVDFGGWDTHTRQGAPEDSTSYLHRHIRTLSDSLNAFWRDLGAARNEVTIVVVSEFGRSIAENGSGGTDHGRAGALMVLGGRVKGGVYGRFPTSIAPGPEGDLAVLNDWRTVMAEVLTTRGGLPRAAIPAVLPGWAGTPLGFCLA